MEKITVNEIALATGGKLFCEDKNAMISSVSIDSRSISEDTLFVALKGEKSDGHDYIEKALKMVLWQFFVKRK
ncbi:MAG: hypothetical protein IKK18_02240 [Clostridia bacterium]|nr:hypothetical protein [Clostridia bacterium]